MPLDPSFIGRSYPPTDVYEVGREKIREFADAVGDLSPAFRDPEAAKALGYADVIAPPTFAIVVTMRAAAQVVLDPELGLDFTRVVHGDQRFEYSRPIQAGDRLAATVTVDNIRTRAGSDFITTRTVVDTIEGEHVVTAFSSLVARGED